MRLSGSTASSLFLSFALSVMLAAFASGIQPSAWIFDSPEIVFELGSDLSFDLDTDTEVGVAPGVEALSVNSGKSDQAALPGFVAKPSAYAFDRLSRGPPAQLS